LPPIKRRQKAAAKSGDKKWRQKTAESLILSQRSERTISFNIWTDTPEASSTQIADAIGLQVSRTKMYLAELVSDGAVVAEGSSRTRKYRLKS
jgi:ATP-dependent DNA helicase RecG